MMSIQRLLMPAALVAILAIPALAGGPPPTFESEPDQGPPGTVITVSGSMCTRDISPRGFGVTLGGPPQLPGTTVHVELVGPQPGTKVWDEDDITPEQNGDWVGQLRVPQNAPPGTDLITATCNPDDLQEADPFNYAPNTFRVLAEARRATPVETVVTFTG